MNTIDSFSTERLNMPLLASRGDVHTSFQYVLHKVDAKKVAVAIPNWVVSRDHLSPGDLINLHVRFTTQREAHDQGVVTATKWDPELQAQICEIELNGRVNYADRVFVRLDLRVVEFAAADSDLLPRIVKDLFLLKKGVLIYWDHLIPFFSRIARYPQADFPMLKEVVMLDVRKRIQQNMQTLSALNDRIADPNFEFARMVEEIDLEVLRHSVESEISSELFEATFPNPQVRSYIDSIKDLENRLYLNYNLLVLIYSHTLG